MLTIPKKTLQLWKLSDEQIAKIKSIAQRFLELENIIRQESQKIESVSNIRVLDQDDWVQDFEIEATMSCYIGEDEDNILCVVPGYNIANQRDWNEQLDSRFAGDFHCGSFWWLYSAMQVSWENILRIDSIYLDLNVVYQKNLKIL